MRYEAGYSRYHVTRLTVEADTPDEAMAKVLEHLRSGVAPGVVLQGEPEERWLFEYLLGPGGERIRGPDFLLRRVDEDPGGEERKGVSMP